MYRIAFLCILFAGVAKCDFNPYDHAADDQRFTPEQLQSMKSRSANTQLPAWPGGQLAYIMDPGFANSKIHVAALTNAINELQNKTCIKIFPRKKDEKNYLKFKNSGPQGGCNTFCGMVPAHMQPQEVNIADWCTSPDKAWFSTVHEIVHALGFIHEQCRPDRDDYVVVNSNNPEGKNVNYQKIPIGESKIMTKYDYDSVMHYPATPNLLTPKDPKIKIGQRDHLSPCDIAKINRYYNCPATYAQNCPTK